MNIKAETNEIESNKTDYEKNVEDMNMLRIKRAHFYKSCTY